MLQLNWLRPFIAKNFTRRFYPFPKKYMRHFFSQSHFSKKIRISIFSLRNFLRGQPVEQIQFTVKNFVAKHINPNAMRIVFFVSNQNFVIKRKVQIFCAVIFQSLVSCNRKFFRVDDFVAFARCNPKWNFFQDSQIFV